MQNPDEPRKEKNLAAGARTPDSTDQVEHATSAPPPVLWLPSRGHRLPTKAACQRLGFQALRVLLLLRDPNASYQDLLDIVRGG